MRAMWWRRRATGSAGPAPAAAPARSARDRDGGDALHEATHDLLTGLPNGALLRLRVEDAAARWRRSSVLVARVVNLDVIPDGARNVTLREVGRRLRESAGPADLVARTGHDEFTVLVDGDRFAADEVAQVALDAVEHAIVVAGTVVRLPEPVRLAIGIAALTGGDGSDALRAADDAADVATRSGSGIHHALDDGVPAAR